MPYKPKAREARQKPLNEIRQSARNPGFNGPAILLGEKGGLTRKEIGQVIERIKEKREAHFKEKIPYVRSHDRALLGKWTNATATDVAMRISRRYLMKPLKGMKLSPEQIEVISRIITRRATQTVPGTNIKVRQPLEFYLIELANSFGENGHEKAQKVLESVGKRGKKLYEMSNKAGTPSDMFINVYQRADAISHTLLLSDPRTMIAMLPSLIRERYEEIERLKTLSVPNKETIIKNMEQELGKTRREYLQYRVNHSSIF